MRALAILCLLCGVAFADEPVTAEWKLGERPHVDIPFRLDLLVGPLEESPAPEQPKLDIPDATVQPLGAEVVGQNLSIVGNRRVMTVTYALRYQVTPHKVGALHVPAITAAQGSRSATTKAGDTQVEAVATSDDMKLELSLPNRPIYAGELVQGTLNWTFKGQPGDPRFNVPLFDNSDLQITVPQVDDRVQGFGFLIGGKEVRLPVTQENAADGAHRIAFRFVLMARKSGSIAVAPASVFATLAAGRSRYMGDAKMYRASDAPRALEVRALPETDKPASFAGEVGDNYAIKVGTSRSVVSLGEPVELAITVTSNKRLETLALPRLDGEGELPRDKFKVPQDPPTGELSEDGKTKTFKVTAQVTGATSEIPALAFSYFDPARGTYQTVHSDPIALSVKGGSIVGAGDVVAAPTKKQTTQATTDTDLSPVAADLALSSPGAADASPLGGALLWIVCGALYAVPLGLFFFRRWQVKTASSREEAGEAKQARKRVEALLDKSASAPARETAGPLAAAVRGYAKVLGQPADDQLLAKLETESFSPTAGDKPLSPDLRSDLAGLLRKWGRRAAVIAILLLAPHANADVLASGRQTYQDAMAATDAAQRRVGFARAASELGDAARTMPDRPELLTDWGNAALGAGDVATATLAYRRALALDASSPRAKEILGWLRSRQSDAFRPTTATAASDTLFFFHAWPRGRRLLVGAIAFALAIGALMLRRARVLAVLPAAVWVAMCVSVLVENRHTGDAIVMDDVVMRAADSSGAPAAMQQSLPRGAEVTVLERRDAWSRVEIASGQTGWVPAGSVEAVLVR